MILDASTDLAQAQTWASWAMVLLTVVLVAVTAFYAVQNRRMVDEMVTARSHSLLPVLTCRLDFENKFGEGNEPYTIAFIKNTGNAAAIGVKVRARVLNPERLGYRVLLMDEWDGRVIDIGGEHKFYVYDPNFHDGDVPLEGKAEFPKVELTLSYQNVYGIHFSLVSTFEKMTTRQYDKYPWVWVTRQELTSALN